MSGSQVGRMVVGDAEPGIVGAREHLDVIVLERLEFVDIGRCVVADQEFPPDSTDMALNAFQTPFYILGAVVADHQDGYLDGVRCRVAMRVRQF